MKRVIVSLILSLLSSCVLCQVEAISWQSAFGTNRDLFVSNNNAYQQLVAVLNKQQSRAFSTTLLFDFYQRGPINVQSGIGYQVVGKGSPLYYVEEVNADGSWEQYSFRMELQSFQIPFSVMLSRKFNWLKVYGLAGFSGSYYLKNSSITRLSRKYQGSQLIQSDMIQVEGLGLRKLNLVPHMAAGVEFISARLPKVGFRFQASVGLNIQREWESIGLRRRGMLFLGLGVTHRLSDP